jgi:predicted phage baseplate assembly protein
VLLRSRDRAVTAEDFALLAREAAPEAGRVHCIPASERDAVVRVLVVPALGPAAPGFADLVPAQATVERIAARLDERRLLGTSVSVEPPRYQGVTVVARVRSLPDRSTDAVRQAAVDALDRLLHPLHGGPDGTGWPFGRAVHVGEVYALLQRLPGVDLVEDVRLFRADPRTNERAEVQQRVEVAPHALVHGYRHQVLVERSRFL